MMRESGKREPAERPIIVIGSGVAGLTAALAVAQTPDAPRVTVITKGSLPESNTDKAQGGVAVALFPGDSPKLHASDTIAAGAGLNDADAVTLLTRRGPDAVRALLAEGAHFDPETDAATTAADRRAGAPVLAHGYEAAHSFPRVIHAHGDATGHEVETSLIRAVRRLPHSRISVLEHTMLLGLVVEGNRVRGVRVAGEGRTVHTIESSRVILATGGAGCIYRRTFNP